MIRTAQLALAASALALCAAAHAQTAVSTVPFCTLAGLGDMRVKGQEQLRLYGTDLGYTYERPGEIAILFGDTWDEAAPSLEGLLPDPKIPRDDAYGVIDLKDFPDGDSVEAACRANGGKAPLVRFATVSPTTLATLDPGVAMDGLKTPTFGFSTGRRRKDAREYALFVTGKPAVCRADPDCAPMVCDTGLGTIGRPPEDMGPGLTFACVDGAPGCNAATIPGEKGPSGICRDPGSSIAAPGNDASRTISVLWRQLVGVRRQTALPANSYKTREWVTNRLINTIATTAEDFDLSRAGGRGNDYSVATGDTPAGDKVLVWGRPGWTSLIAEGQKLHLYFAVADMPKAGADDSFDWNPQYFTGVDASGRPTFSADQSKAAPLDLSGGQGNPDEPHDIVSHQSFRWIPELGKWVLIYSGGAQTSDAICSTVSTDCKKLKRGNAAVRMRTADHPWGPWSKPQDLIAGGDPYAGPVPGSQFAPGGMLAHPDCKDPTCAPRSIPPLSVSDTGALYGANLIDPWTEKRSDGTVDLYWNVSTWSPYRVTLMKTTLKP